MRDSIILSSYLFGSVYLFSESIKNINMWYLNNKKMPYSLIFINGSILGLSGFCFVYSCVYNISK